MTMDCRICSREFAGKRKPVCISCAQATLYAPRVQQATALLNRENVHTHVEAIVRPGNDGILAALPEDADWDAIEKGIKTHSFERARTEKEVVEGRIKDITDKSEQLRRQLEDYRMLAAKRKEENARRRSDVETEREQLRKHRTRTLEPVHLTIRKAKHRLNKVHGRTIEAREYLCKEASSLHGLKRAKNHDGKSLYWLMGLPLPDLRDLNGGNGRIKLQSVETPSGTKVLVEPHELISTSLENLCRFIGICCHYLSIRLPAEIILPHNDFPHAATLPIDSSYRSRSSNSRPRLLQLQHPLPQLQKDDPKTAAFFREAVVLLAYDLAWLSRCQGLETITSFEDVCELGRNLLDLFPRPGKSPEERRVRLGSHTHGSVHNSLTGPAGDALVGPMSGWGFSIAKLADQLKAYLRREMARAEWDVITDTEWDEELEDERPVIVGGMRKGGGAAMSVVTVKPSDGEEMRKGGRRGWMKV